ncbi:MAG: FAD-dependent oxidoreductase [Dehalococcoidia bacterium]
MTDLPKLFSPINIGSMELKNRIVMSPMHTDFANNDGTISPRLKTYLVTRAKGGAGIITMEIATIDGKSPYMPNTIGIWDDKFITGLSELAAEVHSYDAKIVPQISHPGPESLAPFFYGIQPMGPSPLMAETTKQMCREMTAEDIEKTIEQYGDAARRAREAGFDGMELHAAHAYMLIGSFLSSLRNRRTDRYGGSIEGRLTFALEVIENIRRKAGKDFPLIIRISGDELAPGGRNIRETQYIAPRLVEAGVNAFHVSAGSMPQTSWRIMPPTGTPLGINVPLAADLKKVVDVPVMAVGRINHPLVAEDILQRGEADITVMGRALIADPDFPNKALERRFEDIAPCLACGNGCSGRKVGTDLTCVVNPTVGKEDEMLPLEPASQPKKVMVIGGGPGGLEAARISALRGHQVTLYEKEASIGGQFRLAAVPPMKQELTRLIRYFEVQLEKAGVEVRLNTEVTPELVEEVKPDVAIIATGAESLILNIPGIDGKRVVTAHQVLAGEISLPRGKVLVIGGGLVGLETAEYLASPGDNPIIGRTEVTIIEMLSEVGLDMSPEVRVLSMQKLRESGAQILTSTKVEEFLEDGVVVSRNGQKETITGMKRIVLAMGARPVEVLSAKLKGKVNEVHVIGDAKAARRALEAIAEGAQVGREI